MSKHEPIQFLPPDEPTAAYPIGGLPNATEVVAEPLPEVAPDPTPRVATPVPVASAPGLSPMEPLLVIGVLGISVCLALVAALAVYFLFLA